MKKLEFHYSWIILAVGVTVVAGSLGIGRFSYGILLPSLQEGLNLTHNQTGLIASANMLGYTLATLAVGRLSRLFGPRMVISISLLWVALTMAAVGLAGGLFSVLLLRFLTGIGTAGANISIMGLSSSWFSGNRRGFANGFLVGGSGLAIFFTGWLVPWFIESFPEQGWRYIWLFLGMVVLIFALVAAAFIGNHPKDKGLEPIGSKTSSKQKEETEKPFYSIKELLMFNGVLPLAFAYLCFGASFIIYTTFLVSFLIGEKGLTPIVAGDIWSLVGFLSIGSAIIWGSLSDVMGRPYTLMVVFTLQALSYLLIASTTEITLLWLSAIIFGFTAWSIPGIMAASCGDLLGPKNATGALGLVTLFFSIGSVFGPALAGYIKEASGSFTTAFHVAALIAIVGCALSFLLVHRKENPCG